MKRSLGTLAVATGLIAGLATVALAEVIPEKFSIGPFIGGYTFDSSQNYKGAFTTGGRLGYDFTKNFGAELGLGIAFTETKGEPSENAKVNRYGFDLLYHLLPDSRLDPYLAAGFGGINLGGEKGGNPTSRGAFDYGIGARYYLNNDIALRADIRHILVSEGQMRNNFEYTAGLTFFFDIGPCGCPTTVAPAPVAAPAPAPVAPPKPAPAPVVVAPQATIVATPASILSGQNSTLNWSSQNATTCTIEPGIGQVAPQGSMVVSPPAGTSYTLNCQGDGGTASSTTAVAVTAPAPAPAKPTCTIAATPTTVDKGTAATLNWSSRNATTCDLQPGVGTVNPQGTLSVTPAADTTYTLNCQGAGGSATSTTAVAVTMPPAEPEKPCQSVTLDIKFDTSKADIKGQYTAELQKFADILKENPKATAVIEGHTDNVGDADMNLKLSQRRADSVRGFLINKLGVAAERLSAQGFGLTKPIASNKTTDGKSKNRRIDAKIFCGK